MEVDSGAQPPQGKQRQAKRRGPLVHYGFQHTQAIYDYHVDYDQLRADFQCMMTDSTPTEIWFSTCDSREDVKNRVNRSVDRGFRISLT